MTDYVDSKSDERTANNAVRHQYRVLSDDEKAQMVAVKDAGAKLIEVINQVFQQKHTHYTRLALDNAELAVMWAVKELTK